MILQMLHLEESTEIYLSSKGMIKDLQGLGSPTVSRTRSGILMSTALTLDIFFLVLEFLFSHFLDAVGHTIKN